MKVSRTWLQTFFDQPLPSAEALSDALTFHVFEIEEQEGELLDVNVLPDRAAYGLSHRGMAYELSAILGIPLKSDPLKTPYELAPVSKTLSADVGATATNRYIAAHIQGVSVGPSPKWLADALASVGQRSINNIVDATNYVMLSIGQPLHAFDTNKLTAKEGIYALAVRGAKSGEKITALTGDEYTLTEGMMLIADGNSGTALGIAGIKGGKAAEITESTTDIIIESANFDGTRVRKTAQVLKLFTDASLRFQNRPSPELAGYGMRDVVALVLDIAGGTLEGFVDVYPGPREEVKVTTTLTKINQRLGTNLVVADVERVFKALSFAYELSGETFVVTSPFERNDITIPEDIAEEVGRIVGYDTLPLLTLTGEGWTVDQAEYRGIQKIKDELVAKGFIEILTPSFAANGDIKLANPLDQSRPYLRASLTENMNDALGRAKLVAPLVLGPNQTPKLFEIGSVFRTEGESIELETSEMMSGVSSLAPDAEYQPVQYDLGAYVPFSTYPFALRDVAVWTPAGTELDAVKNTIVEKAGSLLARIDLFDRFEKEGRISYAFRLVFSSMEKTLSDEDLNPVMEGIYTALKAQAGFEIR